MSFNKIVSLVLIGSQMGLGTIAFGATTATTTTATPEFTLLENVIALQGMNLSQSDMQTNVKNLLQDYSAKAQVTGQTDRMQAALVDLGVYTPAQAAGFASSAQASAAKITASNPGTNDQAAVLMGAEINQLVGLHPAGAQFSGCSIANLGDGDVASAVLGAGAVTLIVGLVLRFDNPTCVTPVVGTTVVYGPDGYEGTATDYGPTTCSVDNYYPHAQAGDDVMIAGGIVAAVGAVLMILNNTVCD